MTKEIKSDKIIVQKLFELWFRVPEYQRSYVWENDQINNLLEDITDSALHNSSDQYFMGSLVFHTKKYDIEKNYLENDLLDGQQRLTTLMLIFAVIRDLTNNDLRKRNCQEFIFQEINPDKKIPERIRILYDTRDSVKTFIDEYVKQYDGTKKTNELINIYKDEKADLTMKNMSNAILKIKEYFEINKERITEDIFYPYLLNNVIMIYVSTEDLEDAFRMFTVLNARGLPLSNSDILKAKNLGALDSDTDRLIYGKIWEDIENSLNDDFDRFLSHIRTILVKERARLNLLKEFEDVIYAPKEKDKSTGKQKPALLKMGKETLDLIRKYYGIYEQLFLKDNIDLDNTFEFDNLITIMNIGLPSTDWIPPLLCYYNKFNSKAIFSFLKILSNKFSGDWISGEPPTTRIENMNKILKMIGEAKSSDQVLQSNLFNFDSKNFVEVINGNIYKRKFSVFILLILDFIYKSKSERIVAPNIISIEHILPQNPDNNSQWRLDFTESEHELYIDKLGNLVLISKAKNSSQGNSDYLIKKIKYFKNRIESFANSLRVLETNAEWKVNNLKNNHIKVIDDIKSFYNI